MKKINKFRKVISIFCLIIILLAWIPKETKASFSINQADLYYKGKCVTLLKVRSNGGDITVSKIFYPNNGKEYPAYCMNVERPGAESVSPYNVSVENAVQNQLIRRAIINGYPYQSLATLGVANEDEAYTATKQAVYCVLYGYDANDFNRYLPVGEAGARTLNAMKQIVNKARNGTEIKPSNLITISQITEWKQYTPQYIESSFEINTSCNFKDCELKILGSEVEGIKIVNENYEEINKLNNKGFKVLVPTEKLNDNGTFEIMANGQLETMPILYGKASSSSYQDYALAGEIYEGGSGSAIIEYEKNKSKLIIIKEDEETKERLDNIVFRIIDKESKIIYDNLTTNEEGEVLVEGILPGTYYIEEIKGKENYKALEEKIEFTINVNEELTINVNNKKIEKKERESKKIKRTVLPKTGM